jgi:hypothetical protein
MKYRRGVEVAIASWQLVQYQQRVLSPPTRLAGQVPGLRFWRPLNIGGDFGWFREHPSRWALYPRLKPDFRHWAYYGVWDDDAVLDRFLADPPRRWADGWVESLSLRLRPTSARGPWPGIEVLGVPSAATAIDGPIVHIVRLDLSLRGTLAMWGSAAPHILHFLPDAEDMLLGIPLVDRPYTQPVSLSVWRSEDAVRQFATRGEGHRHAVTRVQRSQRDLRSRYSTASFEPYACKGTWKGRNPLVGAIGAGTLDQS